MPSGVAQVLNYQSRLQALPCESPAFPPFSRAVRRLKADFTV